MADEDHVTATGPAEPDTEADDTQETEKPSSFQEPAAKPGPKPRRSRRRRWILGLSIPGGVIIVLVIAAFVTAHYTSASSFCNTCHEMNAYYASWRASKHATAECRDCHIPPGAVPYIETKLGSFREIYVHLFGNPDAPLAVTREIPNASCYRCHDNPPADPSLANTTFSHAKHDGLHCIACHIRVVHKGVGALQQVDPGKMSSCFACHDGKTAPNNCSYCHTSPHEKRGECSVCHNTSGWTEVALNHPFALTGSHAGVPCAGCHVTRPGVATIPGTDLAKADPSCVSCHKDQHGGLTDCAGCHTPTAWANVDFEHPFTLTGAHATLTCAQCHVSKAGATPVPGTQFPAADPSCISCHNDQHGGLTDCAGCHTPTVWTETSFKHQLPLTGAHASLTCAQCHVSTPGGELVPGTRFPAAGSSCVSCHGDRHKGLTDCARCHTPTTWTKTSFKHPFALTGAHASLTCAQCHVSRPGGRLVPGTRFPAAGSSCVSCHGDRHRGLRDCARCHSPTGWKPAHFTHPVVGEHGRGAGISCVKCHPNGYGSHYCSCHGGTPSGD